MRSRTSISIAGLMGLCLGFPTWAQAQQEQSLWGLPWLSETATRRGVVLPKPIGVGLMYAHYREDLVLDDVELSADTGQRGGIDFVELSESVLETDQMMLRFDAWLFPFMNVFATVGLVDNSVRSSYSFSGEDVLTFLGQGDRCAQESPPDVCSRTFSNDGGQDSEGNSYSLGTVLAVGRASYFGVTGISYTWNDVDSTTTTIETLAITPRVGRRISLADAGEVAVFVGGLYLNSDVRITQRYTIQGPDSDINILVTAKEKNARRWSYVAGAAWDLGRNWNLQAEVGFGDSREGFIASVTRRF